MSSFIALRKTFDLSSDSNTHLLVGRQNRAIPTATLGGAIVTTMKQHYDFIVDVQFDSQGGSSCQDQRFALGSLYQSLPEPTKPQCIFEGWYTKPIGGTKIDTTSRVELSTTILYAHWEYVQIDSDCTSYSVTTTSSYKKTGIYVASIANSSQPIYIDWGDGAVEKMTSSISQKSHTYKTTGNFTVKISNNIASFAPSYNNSTWYETTSQNRYTFKGMISTGSKVTSLPTYAFYYCSAMTNIDFMETCWPTVMSLPHYCFYYCSGLASIQGAKRFTSLGSYCFRYCSGLSGIQDLSEFKFTTLPNSYTFANCINVTQWILPDGFNGTNFGSYMFANNTKLSAFVLPNSLTSTGIYTFQNCSNLDDIIIPSKVQSIGNHAFYGCTSLSNVSIEATGLTAINQYAFYNCSKLAGLDLPDAVKTIGNYAFYGCTSLDYAGRMANDLPYDAEIEYLESTGKQYIDTGIRGNSVSKIKLAASGSVNNAAWLGCGTSSSSSDRLLVCTKPTTESPATVTCRMDGTLTNTGVNCESITDIEADVVNQTITTNGVVTSVEFSGGITDKAIYLFAANYELPMLINGNNRIYLTKFYNVNGILIFDAIPVRKGNIGYMYDKVSGKLFGNSGTGNFIIGPDVKTKELPSQLTSIGANAYQGCGNLKSLNIPENLQTIGDYAFAGCYQISSIVDKRLSAQAVSTNTFGSATGTSNTAFTGYQTRGSNILSTYFAATGYDENAWDDPLQNPDKCGFIQQYIDPENVHWCTIVFDAGSGSVSPSTKQVIYGQKIRELPEPTCPADKPYFGGWYTEADGAGTKYSANSTAPSQDSLTLHAFYSAVSLKSYTVDLNGQWRQSTAQTNPDSSMYDGVYESNSNYNVGNGFAKMYVRISGYDEFTIYIRSYGESSYDYTLAFNPDVDVTSNPSTSTSGVKAHTSGKQQSGQAIENYTKVTYTDLTGKDHFICVVYRKDSSVNKGNDRGYVLIPKEQ